MASTHRQHAMLVSISSARLSRTEVVRVITQFDVKTASKAAVKSFNERMDEEHERRMQSKVVGRSQLLMKAPHLITWEDLAPHRCGERVVGVASQQRQDCLRM